MATQVLSATITGTAIVREANGIESLTLTVKVADATAATLATGLAADKLRPVDGGAPVAPWPSAAGQAVDVQYDDATFEFVGIAMPV